MGDNYTLFEYIPIEILQTMLERMAMASYREIEKAVPLLATKVAEVRQRRLGNSSSVAILEPVYIELESIGKRELYIPFIRNRPILESREIYVLVENLDAYYLPHTAKYVCQHSDAKGWRGINLSRDANDEWVRNVVKLDLTEKELEYVIGRERYEAMYG